MRQLNCLHRLRSQLSIYIYMPIGNHAQECNYQLIKVNKCAMVYVCLAMNTADKLDELEGPVETSCKNENTELR